MQEIKVWFHKLSNVILSPEGAKNPFAQGSFGIERLRMTSFIALLFIPLLSGCRIEFDATSVVREDGAIERTSIYRAQEASDKEELKTKYELPPGGKWEDSPLNIFSFVRKEPDEVMVSAYEVKQMIPAGAAPASDFKRLGNSPEKFAGNQFSAAVRETLRGREYTYLEKFSDIINFEKIKSALNQVLDQGLKFFEGHLAGKFQNPELVGRMIREAKTVYTDLLFQYYQAATGRDVNFDEIHKLADELGKIFTPEYTSDIFAKKFPELDSPEKRTLVAEAFHATEKDLNDYLEKNTVLKESADEIFGAHGFTLFHYYDFKVKLTMPGKIVETNGEKQPDGSVVWTFNSEKLNQTLSARSRTGDYRKLALVLLAPVMIILILVFLRSKPKKK